MSPTLFRMLLRSTVAAWLLATSTASSAAPQDDRSPDARARRWVAELTLDEKIGLVTGRVGADYNGTPKPVGSLGSAGYVAGVPRLGIPALQITDAGLGVTNPPVTLTQRSREGDVATALPSVMSTAATWDPQRAYANGALMGAEARAKGFNMLLAGSINLVREPLGGRNFEYPGEDPLLAGVIVGETIRGVQSQGVMSTIKHFAINDQETDRFVYDARIGEGAMRESDLLAFELGIERGRPSAVMCAYNRVGGEYACENSHLLTDILKTDWKFPGFVLSDWGAVHSTAKAANAGLDQESALEFDSRPFFGDALKQAVRSGAVPAARLDDMVFRILRSEIAAGVVDTPAVPTAIDFSAHAIVAQQSAAAGIVLLKNDRGLLPLSSTVRSILVIGGHADKGVLSGGGSSQVTPPGGYGLVETPPGLPPAAAAWRSTYYLAPSPLAAIRAAVPGTTVKYLDGTDIVAAAAAAKKAAVVVLFAVQPLAEGADAKTLSLPDAQDALIQAVGEANRKTIVVLETAGPVLMPWLAKTPSVLESWYPGSSGAAAIADILFGVRSPQGRLPVTFPASLSQTPRPAMAASPASGVPSVAYIEGSDVGYRWQARHHTRPLFSFGFGLSFTRFAYSRLVVRGGDTIHAEATVSNTGKREGMDVVQFYAAPANGKGMKRLIGWTKVSLKPGESRSVGIDADPRLLAAYDMAARRWSVPGDPFIVTVAHDAADIGLSAMTRVAPSSIATP